MGNKWEKVKLGNIVTIRSGKSRPSESGIYPIYGGNGIFGRANTFNEENIVIVGRVGAYCGCVYFEKDKLWLSDNALGVKANDMSDLKYIYYLLTSFNLNSKAIGGAQPLLTQGILNEIEVTLPPLPVQQSIAQILSSIDDKIELLREENKTLEAIAETLFIRWFVDFEYPNEQGKPYKSSGGKLVESELGLIPDKWSVRKLGDVVETITKGTTPTTIGGRFTEFGINFIKAESITESYYFDKNKISYIDEMSNELLRRSKILPGDLLFTIAGTIGRFAIVPKELTPANTNQAVAIIRTKTLCKSYFLLSLLKLKEIRNSLLGNVVEAVQANLSLTTIKDLQFRVPDEQFYNLFEYSILPFFTKISTNHLEIESLNLTRNSLLPKLMNNEVKV
jgi:type I restriction enzyme S subunit